MGKLFLEASKQTSLRLAWHKVRSNGVQSQSLETRIAIERFEREADRNIIRIQRKLRNGTFEFGAQKGVLKTKSSGGKRGIVMAPVHNRVVERAWLDCLQEHVPFVREVISMPTSVGGVPDRSVPHGLALVRDAIADRMEFFVRADISGFFDNIPRLDVLSILGEQIDDQKFLQTLEEATKVTLKNEESLGEDRKAFPTNSEGVAQGSPLSPLFGNLLLRDFI